MSGRRQAKGAEGPGWTSAYFAKPGEMEFSGDKLINCSGIWRSVINSVRSFIELKEDPVS